MAGVRLLVHCFTKNTLAMLKKLLSKIIGAAIKIGRKQLDKLKNNKLARLIEVFVNAGGDVMHVLLDNDDNNEKQLLELLKRHTQRIVAEGAGIGREKLAEMKDQSLAVALVGYLDGAEEVIGALLDEDPNNEAQLKLIWERRKKVLIGDGVDLATDKLSEIIRKKVKDPTLADIIIDILQGIDELVQSPNA